MEELDIVDALARLSFLVQGVLTGIAAAQDLSVTQMRLLGILRDREPGMQELAGHLGLDKSSVSGLVDRAEKRGLVVRVPGAQDRRAVIVTMTAAGRALMTSLEQAATARLTALVAPLTAAQERTLAGLATKVVDAARTVGDDRVR
jgi:DNA-binding MarR family transcriptional regulator